MVRKEISFPIPFYTQDVTEESWQSDGFESFSEGHDWRMRGCGIASLRMVVDAYLQQENPEATCGGQGDMIHKGVEAQAYKAGVGWIHWGLANMAGAYDLWAEARREKTYLDVAEEISKNHPCIISVSPRFAGGEINPETEKPLSRGGHLVVAYGVLYDEAGQVTDFLVHHSSCFDGWDKPQWQVGLEAFTASFSGNFICFSKEKPKEEA